MGIVPGQELIDVALLVANDDGFERSCQPCMGIDAIEFAGFDERGDDRPVFCSRIMAGKESVLAIEGNRPDCPFDTVVVDLDPPVSEE